MSLTNKIDFAVIFTVNNANPNGDPLNGNRPRSNYDRIGEVSDVCIKRKIRNRLMEAKENIFVQSDDNKVDECKNLRERAEKIIDSNISSLDNAALACEEWFDVRAFGQVFAYGGDRRGTGVSIGVRGPVSIHTAFSLSPVEITSTQITKSVSGEGEGKKKSSDTMGMKHRVDHGTYIFYGSMNPQLASKTGFSDDDAETIKKVLPKLFENDASSARPEGSMEILKVVWWDHKCPNGKVSSAKVHRSLKVTEDENGVHVSVDKIGELAPVFIEGY